MLTDYDLGNLVALFALPETRTLFPELRLRLHDPAAFQDLCFTAAMQARDAFYEERNDLWYIDFDGVGAVFKSIFPGQLFDADRDRAREWFRNCIAGYGADGDLLAIWAAAVIAASSETAPRPGESLIDTVKAMPSWPSTTSGGAMTIIVP